MLCLGLLASCTTSVRTDAEGRHAVNCSNSGATTCHREAKRHCGKLGYRVIAEVTDAGSQAGGAEVSLISVRDRVRVLTFRCNTPGQES